MRAFRSTAANSHVPDNSREINSFGYPSTDILDVVPSKYTSSLTRTLPLEESFSSIDTNLGGRSCPERGTMFWNEVDKRDILMSIFNELEESSRSKRLDDDIRKSPELHRQKFPHPNRRRTEGDAGSIVPVNENKGEKGFEMCPHPINTMLTEGRPIGKEKKKRSRFSFFSFLNKRAKERKRQETEKRRNISRLQNDLCRVFDAEIVAL